MLWQHEQINFGLNTLVLFLPLYLASHCCDFFYLVVFNLYNIWKLYLWSFWRNIQRECIGGYDHEDEWGETKGSDKPYRWSDGFSYLDTHTNYDNPNSNTRCQYWHVNHWRVVSSHRIHCCVMFLQVHLCTMIRVMYFGKLLRLFCEWELMSTS